MAVKTERNITIVGAGLVGSLLAVLLRKKGFGVSIYEKRSDIRKAALEGDRSINLVITSRGLNGLEQAGLLSEALKLSVPILGRMIHPKPGDLMFQPYGNESECNFSISRSKLNQFLLDAAEKSGAKIYFDHSLEDLDLKNRKLTFDVNGKSETARYDLLFGTDGAGSRVRKFMCRSLPHTWSEQTEWLDADYKELFLPAGPAGQFLIEKNALHIWPRGSHMMMALANLDGSFTMTLYMPRERQGSPNFSDIVSQQDVEKLFKTEFSDAVPLMPNYLKEFADHPQGRLGTVRTTKWIFEDSVVLLGDAAHAIVPFFGQGMNAGFEDCTELLKLIESESDWWLVLQKFERSQKPNADAIADMAIENWYEMRDRVGDAQFLLRKKVEALLEKKFPQYFKSRYAMVTYTLNPYVKAREAGRIHDRILAQLCDGIQKPEDVDLKKAELLLSELHSFNIATGIALDTEPLVAKARKMFKV